jgi:hypothetical protein
MALVVALVAVVGGVGLTPARRAAAACTGSALDALQAGSQAALCGEAVEVLSGRTVYDHVFANPDGSFYTVESVVPSSVRRPDGSWVSIDTTLIPSAGGWSPRAALATMTLSNGGTGPFITYQSGGATLSLSWPWGALPAPVVSGSKARFPGVLPGVDLWVVVTSTGFRPVLQVANATAAANPALRSIPYQVGGTVHGVMLSDGRARFADAQDNTVAVTDPAAMWDSTVDTAAGEGGSGDALLSTVESAGDTAKLGQITVSTSGSDLTVTPDPAMLADPGLTFPMFLDPSVSPSQSKWAYADSANENNTTDKARVGKSPDDGSLYRSYFNFSTTQGSLTWRGKRILSAEFDIELYHSYACSDNEDDWAWAYNVSTLTTTSSRMPWSGSGSRWLPGAGGVAARGFANKAGGCGALQPDMLMQFGGSAMTSQVQHVADQNASVYAIGLCACNASGQFEDVKTRWKKFYIDSRAKLIVKYDTVPGTPTNLTTSGAACGSNIGTTSPTLSAKAVDADSGDTLTASFEYQQVGSSTSVKATRSGVPAGNLATWDLSGLAQGVSYQWRVQTVDAAGSQSPQTGWCTFSIVSAPPPIPTVKSATYPECTSTSCTPSGGPGIPGSFVLTPNASNITSFSYGWSSPPTTTVSAVAGTLKTIILIPPHVGLNTLYVSGNNGTKSGGIASYPFVVSYKAPPVAWWPLDDQYGYGFTDKQSTGSLAPTGGVTWKSDARNLGFSSLTFAGDSNPGYATQSVPLDTSHSFSVAAWVMESSLAPGNRTAVSQDAGTGDDSAFYLGTRQTGSPATPHWAFMMQTNAASSGGGKAIFSTAALDASTVGKWVHLLGVYNELQQTMSLYVNGVLAASGSWTTPWKATGPVAVGHAKWNGGDSDSWPGSIADVQVWNRVVTTDDLWGADPDPSNGLLDPMAGLVDPIPAGSWDFNTAVDKTSAQGTAGQGQSLVLNPGPPSCMFTLDSQDGMGGLWTDGKTGNASTAGPTLRTDQSFTVSVWVKVDPSLPSRNLTVLSQDGATNSAFYLGYEYTHTSSPAWGFRVGASDTTSPGLYGTFVATDAATATGEWNHLIGVYDAFARTVTLYVYVKGAMVAKSVTGSTPATFQANGPFRVGAAKYLGAIGDQIPGWIDRVDAFQGVASDRFIAALDAKDPKSSNNG